MDSETQLALDSNVLVAATVGPADRLWPKWKTFDAKAPASRFVPSLVLQEFYEVTEGVGSAQPGIFARLVSDTQIAIRLGGRGPPSDAALAAQRITGNRLDKVRLLLADFIRQIGAWDSSKARNLLREFEQAYAIRKADFLGRHPVISNFDPLSCAMVQARLERLVPGGGQSWTRDCGILSQVDYILRAGSKSGHFVTEDAHHIGRHARDITQLTVIQRVRDLTGSFY